MIRSDNHLHTFFSTDSDARIEEIIDVAAKKGLRSLCFTDHMDYDFPGKTNKPEFVFDPYVYTETLQRQKEAHPDMDIRTGVELGLKKEVLKKGKELTRTFPFDFVIGSTHLVDNIDPYEEKYWETFGETGGISRYYEVTLENINLDFDYDVYGHIDYVLRYCPTVKKAIKEQQSCEAFLTKALSNHAEKLREILLSLIKDGKGIEINTSGFKYGLGHPNPHETLISYYRELGGTVISVGSDAHKACHVGYDFEKIPAILKTTGFSYYTEFHKRNPVHISLDSLEH